MNAEIKTETANDAAPVPTGSAEAGDTQRAFSEAISTAERTLTEAAKAAERALREGIDLLRARSKTYRETADVQFESAQQFVVDKVKERPVTAALSGLGIGLVLGLLLSNRSR